MTKVMEHFYDRALCIVMRMAGSIVMTGLWSNLIKSVIEHFDERCYGTL